MANNTELIHEDRFKDFLLKIYKNPKVISDCISRCRRVQIYEGNLKDHFSNDKGQNLLFRLTYTVDDLKMCIAPSHSVPTIKGSKGYKSIQEGTQSLSHAVDKYFEFLNKNGGLFIL